MLDFLQQVAEKAVTHYALPADVSVVMINLSENATYRVQAGDGRRWALRVHRKAITARRPSLPSSPGLWTCVNVEGVVHAEARERHRRRNHPGCFGAACCAVGLGNGFGTRHRRGPFQSHSRCLAKSRPACICMRGNGSARLVQRHTWDFETSLGEEKPHWGRWRDGMGVDAAKAKLFGRTVDLIGRRLKAYGQGE